MSFKSGFLSSINKIGDDFSEVYRYRFVLYQLIRQQLILRYRRTVFGYMWTLLNPLLMMSVTALVFSTIFKMDLKTYAVFLFAGMIPFTYFSQAVTQSGQSLIGNESLIKKIYIPKMVFPLATSIALLVDSLLSAMALFIIIFCIGGQVSFALLIIPLCFFLLFLFSFGFALIMAVCTTYFRDLQHVVGILMQALLFLTPVFYKPDSLSGKVSSLIQINPLTPFIELFRAPIVNGQFPSVMILGVTCLLGILSSIFGLWFFRRCERDIAFRL